MLLIMSSAYVNQELGAEFGRIPPSFLPLANKRLFQHQVDLNTDNQPVYLSLPDDFALSENDASWLNHRKVNILTIDSQLSLGQAIVTAWNLIEDKPKNSLRILFGDTLFQALPCGHDIISVSQSDDNYHWAHFERKGVVTKFNSSSDNIICGYFSFLNGNHFIKELVINKFDFNQALEKYDSHHHLTPITTTDWLDFGHINTYYKSKVEHTTQRAFNSLKITTNIVEKSSSNKEKMLAESSWFSNLPSQFRLYTPQLLKKYTDDKPYYQLEYLYNTALNELFVFSALPTEKLTQIIKNCLNFVSLCQSYSEKRPNTGILKDLFQDKTSDRIKEFSESLGFSLDSKWKYGKASSVSINQVLNDINPYLPKELPHRSVMHGDLCFSNVIYDFRTDRIKVIDPRGVSHTGDLTIYGDYRYDLAKLSHSVLGLYDWIIAGFFSVEFNLEEKNLDLFIDVKKEHKILQHNFTQLVEEQYNIAPISLYAMQIHLFLSMLPLHSDNEIRQQALFANAFRLYTVFKEMES